MKNELMDDPMKLEIAADKLEKRKSYKREAMRRLNNQRREDNKKRILDAQNFITKMKDNGTWDTFDDEDKDFLLGLISANVNVGAQSIFRTLFGASPEVGASFTLKEAFDKTLKGKSTIDHHVREWAKKGTIVVYKETPENKLLSTYTLMEIGELPNR